MTYTQFDDPQTCLHKEGKNYMIIMSKKQLQKFKGKKMLGKEQWGNEDFSQLSKTFQEN